MDAEKPTVTDREVEELRMHSYKIYFCPEFILDAEENPLGLEAQYNVIIEVIDTLNDELGKIRTRVNRLYTENKVYKSRIKELEIIVKEQDRELKKAGLKEKAEEIKKEVENGNRT